MWTHRISLLAFGLLSPTAARAQALASPFATVSQKVDSTTITVEYYRPSARGRQIFGGIVRWGQQWTPGANWATTLEVNRPVKLEGHVLPAGKYSLWFTPVPRPQQWTVVLSRTARRFHVVRPSASDDQLRLTIACRRTSTIRQRATARAHSVICISTARS